MTTERVLTIIAGLFLLAAAVLLWWNNLTLAFVTAILGIVAWFIGFRAQTRARTGAAAPVETNEDVEE